jgi:LysR family transcriptional regulator, glycine cleavage system transcriptional activator
MLNLPPLAWLRAFEVSARHLSFTAAATELGLSQAAVSKQIKLLEIKLGEPLFIRLPRSLKLTMPGEAFLPKVRDAFDRLSSGTYEVFGKRRTDRLTIRAAAGFAVNWLGPRMHNFIRLYPEIELRVISSVWNETETNADFDLDIRYGDGQWPGETAYRLTRESLVPVCSPALRDAGNGLTLPNQLNNHTLIHVLGYKEGWARWLNAANVTLINGQSRLQFDTSLMAIEVAASGAGIAMGRTSLVQKELQSGRLIAPFALQVPVSEAFYLIASEPENNSRNATLFKDWILQETKANSMGR